MSVHTGATSYRYRNAVAAAGDCIHGEQGGDIVRPWTGTPHCALCRRRHPVHWATVDAPALPAGVVRIDGSRRLF